MKNILILDDDPVILEIIKSELSKSGKYNIIIASNGVFGLGILETKSIDLLITDILMPEFDGIQLLSYLKENQINIPVLVITSVNDTDVINQIKKMGISDILKKPIDFIELEKRISFAINDTSTFEKKIDLLPLCKLFTSEKRSSEISIIKGSKKGSLCIKNGQIIYAEFENTTGDKAVEELFSLSDVKIELNGQCNKAEGNINENEWENLVNKFFPSDAKEKINLDISKINDAVEKLKRDLGEGLIATEMWNSNDLQIVAGFNSDPKSRSIFSRIAEYLNNSLGECDFPELDDFYILNLKKNRLILVLLLDNYHWGLIVNRKGSVMGFLISIIIPELKKVFKSAQF